MLHLYTSVYRLRNRVSYGATARFGCILRFLVVCVN
jgi:hypothetical protein